MDTNGRPNSYERRWGLRLAFVWIMASPPVLIVGAILRPGAWLWIPAIGTAILLTLLAVMFLFSRKADSENKSAPRRKPLDFSTELPAGMTLDPRPRDLASLWQGEEPPIDLDGGHFEDRLDGMVAARRTADSEPTAFIGFDHVADDGTRQWYLLVPLRGGPLPPLTVERESGKQDRADDVDTGDASFDQLYAVTGWDHSPAAEAYVREVLSEEVVAQMKEVAFPWRLRGRFLVAAPRVTSARAAISFAQNQGTQLALIADHLPRELYARYAGWYAAQNRLVNPDDLR